MFPFVTPWYDASPSFTSLSSYLHKPAGAYGFIVQKDGHLFAGENRIRFVGMNFSLSANLPATERDAEIIASRLAKYGINCVRLAALDYRPAPNGILQSDMKTLDSSAMQKLDYFIYQLKENGIYVLMQLHVARAYPGLINEPGTPASYGGIDNFFGEAIQQQKEYAAALLTHFNPYIKEKYVNEPAVAMIEINNENALSLRWWDGSLDMAPAIYQKDLASKWNAWLQANYVDDSSLKKAWPNEVLGKDLLANADFANHMNAWQLRLMRGAAATSKRLKDIATDEMAVDIHVERLGRRDYDVQFIHEPLKISQNSSYTLEFQASSLSPRQMTIALIQPEPYKIIYRDSVYLTATSKKFSFVFTPVISSQRARLTFSGLATKTGVVRVSKISLRPGGASGVRQGESLGNIPVVKRIEFSVLTRQLQIDWIKFLIDTENSYWSEMYRYLKNDLNARSLIIGTQQNYSPYLVQQKMDVIDMHGYWDWQKPIDRLRYQMSNKPQVGDGNAGVIGAVASRRIQGKPFIVSEYNYRGANTYATEADLLMFAYASFQDWDGVFIFNYANNNRFGVDRLIGDEGFNGHSNRFVALIPAALMFYRGDVKPSLQPFTVSVGYDALLEKMRVAGPAPATYELGLDIKQPLKSGIGLRVVNHFKNETVNFPAAISSNDLPIISDTGELIWNPGTEEDGTSVFTINTSRTKAVIGYVKNRVFNLGGIQIAPGPTSQDWVAITLTAMSGENSLLKGKVLLTATGSSINSSMMFDSTRTVYSWGKGPVLVEGIPASIILPTKAENVRAWVLDEKGNPKTALKVIDSGNDSARIDIHERYKTVWYMLEFK